MARPAREAIERYMSITGASESLASRRLQEHGGDLSAALNAHFAGLESNTTNPISGALSQSNFADISNPMPSRQSRLSSLLSGARAFRPSLLLDAGYRRYLRNQLGVFTPPGRSPAAANTGEVMGSPVESSRRNEGSHFPGSSQGFEASVRTSSIQGLEAHNNVLGHEGSHMRGNDIEEHMIQAAIEASRKDAEEPSSGLRSEQIHHQEDEDLAHAISLSLELMESEEIMRKQIAELERLRIPVHNSGECSGSAGNDRCETESSLVQDRLKDVKPKQFTNLKPTHYQSQQYKEYPCPAEDPETQLAIKASLLPTEPSLENENAVNLLVRLPDGSRYCRRFLKSDKLKYVFDFIDVSRAVKTGSYRVVRPYPRRAFSVDDATFSLSELGLTNKQEALYLEFI